MSDPTPLRALALTARIAYAQRNQPHTSQLSELSELQKFVKEARRTILDPILTQIALDTSQLFDSEEEEEIDQEEVKRERERAKIRELKKRKISCGLTIPFRSRGPNGVFVRRDLEDESAEVDISLDEGPDCSLGTSALPMSSSSPMDVDPPSPSISNQPSARSFPPSVQTPSTKPSRVRRPSTKLQENLRSYDDNAHPLQRSAGRKSHSTVAPLEEPPSFEAPGKQVVGKRSKDAGKPKSETYKQSWSVSEQHLLERLLEEIPEGEKNRCVHPERYLRYTH